MKLSAQQKRRIREAKHRQAQLEQKHREDINAAVARARQEGHAAGAEQGAKILLEQMLDHAGRLFKQGQDDAAKAVRAVHGLLSI